MICSLRDWQSRIKSPEDFIVQASSTDHNDSWQSHPIGMGYDYVNLPQNIQTYQVGAHENLVLCAISDFTDQQRRPSGHNRRTMLTTLAQHGFENKSIAPGVQYFTELPKYKFVISPEGNGIDCHRHYHALMAGCIPIIEYNHDMFKKYKGCPILYTHNYSEITVEYLTEVYDQMIDTVYDFSTLLLHHYDEETQEDIKNKGNYWTLKLAGREWYNQKPFVFRLQDRYHVGIYHWFMYMLAILDDIHAHSCPILYTTHHELIQVQAESVDLLQPSFQFVKNVSDKEYNIMEIEGVALLAHDKVHDKYAHFLRREILVKNRLLSTKPPSRLLYISRNKSDRLPWYSERERSQQKNRHILNENEVTNVLVDILHFEYVYLEELSLLEKIALFQQAKVIVSPFGGSLFCSLFAHPSTTIIELHHPFSQPSFENHYQYLCEAIGIKFQRYTEVETFHPDGHPITPFVGLSYNIRVNHMDKFCEFVKGVIDSS